MCTGYLSLIGRDGIQSHRGKSCFKVHPFNINVALSQSWQIHILKGADR